MVIRAVVRSTIGCLGLALALGACGPSTSATDAGPSFDGITVPLTSLGATAYAAPLTVGGQTFQTQVDTGSTVTAIAATACGGNCNGVTPVYKPGTGATDKDKTDSATYGDNSMWNGEIFEDQAGVSSDATVKLDFVAISDQSMFFTNNDYQGILGLGPSDLLDPGTTSYPDTLAALGTTEVIAFQECPDSGQMFLGGFDSSVTDGAPELTPMVKISNENPFYAVQIASMGFGSDALGTAVGDFGTTLVDTGTSVTIMPTAIASKILADVNASAGFQSLFAGATFTDQNSECVTSKTVTTDQIDAMLPPFTISFPTTDGSAPKVLSIAPSRSYIYVEGDGTFCLSIVDGGGDASQGSLIGDTLQTAFVTVFDVPHKQIGFAPEKGCATAVAQGRRETKVVRDASKGPWWKTTPWVHAPTNRGPLAHRAAQ